MCENMCVVSVLSMCACVCMYASMCHLCVQVCVCVRMMYACMQVCVYTVC